MFITRFEPCKIFVVALGVLGLISSPAIATDWRSPGSQREAVEGSRSGSSGGSSGGFFQSAPSAADLARQQRLQEAFESNHKGVEFSKAGDWDNAIIWYQSALAKDPDNKIMQQNLAQAQTRLASDKGLDFYHNGDYANAVAFFQEAVNKNPFEKNAAGYADNLAAAKSALQAVTDNKAAASNMQQSIQHFAQTLNAAPVSGGLDFDGSLSTNTSQDKSDGLDFTADIAIPGSTRSAAQNDPMVVDARNVPSGLPKGLDSAIATAYSSAPPGVSDRVRKGFQAVMTKDWKVAKAWFQDALNRDPTNVGLKRLVALTDYSQQDNQSKSVPPATTVTNLQLPGPDDVNFLFPGLQAMKDREAPVFKKLPDGRTLQMPQESDEEFLFGDAMMESASSAPTPKSTATYIVGKDGQLVRVPANSVQKVQTYAIGKDGELLLLPLAEDDFLPFPENSPATKPEPSGKFGEVHN